MNSSSHSSSCSSTAYLELIVGPMFSCKTSRLVEIYKQCQFCNISVAVINHTIDDRYDDDISVTTTLLSTHDKVKIPCIKTTNLFELWSDEDESIDESIDISTISRLSDKYKIATSEVILINEGQFFTDLYEFIIKLLNKQKRIYVCGLDGDFERKPFGRMLELVPLCDKITKLTALCSLCKNGTKAIFSMRLTPETIQTVVGSDNYIPVCRSCYEHHHHNINE